MQKILSVTLMSLLILSQPKANANIEKPKVNIIINALVKSGSEHLVYSLGESLNYQRLNIYSVYEAAYNSYYSNLGEFFQHSATIAKQHLRAPYLSTHTLPLDIPASRLKRDPRAYSNWRELDIKALKKHSNKLVIHLRDPRQALLSMVHHINSLENPEEKPKGYSDLNQTQQIDWCIYNMTPYIVHWLEDWLTLYAIENLDPNGLKILFTTYDELIEDELKLFHKILDFYEIPITHFNYQPKEKKLSKHFRKGDPQEWRQVLNVAQQQRLNEMIPDDLLTRFNWPR